MSRIYQYSGKHLFIVMWKLQNRLNQTDEHCIQAAGFASQTDFALLEILHHLGSQTIKALGDRVRLTSGSITTAIQRLEKNGYIHRRPNPHDRRQTFIHLSYNGRESLKPALEQQSQQLEKAFAALEPAERAEFARLCEKLETSLA